jgi:hypothetical protein
MSCITVVRRECKANATEGSGLWRVQGLLDCRGCRPLRDLSQRLLGLLRVQGRFAPLSPQLSQNRKTAPAFAVRSERFDSETT